MLKFFDRANICDIILDPPLLREDSEALQRLFNKNYLSWRLEFGRIYNIDVEMLKVLYFQIIQNKKKVKITTHKYKLNHYLYKLGFLTNFESLIEKNLVDFKNIELILIGGSADSSSKIIEIVKNIDLKNLTLVIVQHVDPNSIGIFDNILQEQTSYKVTYAKNKEKIQNSHIYLAMKDKHLKVKDGSFYLSNEDKYNHSRPSVSISYESFSNYYKEKLLVIQECGYIDDGVDKLKILNENMTKIIIQNTDECEAKSMPQEAINIDVYDYVLDLENIVYFIKLIGLSDDDELLTYLKEIMFEKYGYDFRLYFSDMFRRRVEVFMLKHGIKTIKDAVGIIIFNRSAFKGFFLELSINVTKLFRKPELFIDMIIFFSNQHKKTHNLKIWSAGCSSGEEPYSIAILLDILGLSHKSTIYATDFSDVVLKEAKNATYPISKFYEAEESFSKFGLSKNLDTYVDKYDNFVIIKENIREKVLFFQHNLVTDSSFNEFDIIICKNVLIYFDDNLQEKVFKLFYDSLKFGAHLILGESENISPKFINNFKQSSENSKIFKKVE